MKLSIIIPVFNEEKTIKKVIERLSNVKIQDLQKEIIVVDDGSTDSSKFKVQSQVQDCTWQSSKLDGIKLFSHSKNMGKGAAVRTGIEKATGDYILIQDADLEYNPLDIEKLFNEIKDKNQCAVYGTRLNRLPNFKRDERTFQFLIHYFGNRFLSLLTSILYGQWITDMETCYKLFPRNALKEIKLQSKGFDFEPEITAKLLKKRYKIIELSITTNPRGYNEGKKLNTIRDGIIALLTLFKYRILD